MSAWYFSKKIPILMRMGEGLYTKEKVDLLLLLNNWKRKVEFEVQAEMRNKNVHCNRKD
jgi:hypothetical protein